MISFISELATLLGLIIICTVSTLFTIGILIASYVTFKDFFEYIDSKYKDRGDE